MEAEIKALTEYILPIVEQYGLAAMFVSLVLETLGLPLPGESALIVTAAAAGAGKLGIWQVALVAYIAAVTGDNIGYLIGRKFGRPVVLDHGARFGITPERYAKAEAVAARYGAIMVVVARFVVLLRQLNGLVAGTTGMRWPVFLAANMVGAALWVGLWATLAYKFGHSPAILPAIGHHLGLVAALLVPILVGLAWIALRRTRRESADGIDDL